MKKTNPISDKNYSGVLRGGGWGSPSSMRASDRDGDNPAYRSSFIGFRLVRNK